MHVLHLPEANYSDKSSLFSKEPKTFSSNDTRAGDDGWLYHRLTLREGSAAIVTRIQMPQGLTQVEAFFRTGRAPTSLRSEVNSLWPEIFFLDSTILKDQKIYRDIYNEL
jgi:hypothetical protein